MIVFDDIQRDGTEPADHLISAFDYLNASGRQEALLVRNQVEAMFDIYPSDHKAEMRRRLRSRDDNLHHSSFFELALHELVVRQGFKILEVEPELQNGRAPDFLVDAGKAGRFYLEATLATGRPDAEAGGDRRLREAIQAIDDAESPDFFLHLRTRGIPDRPVATANLRRAVEQFVDGLDYDASVSAIESGSSIPHFQHEEHGLYIRLEPYPKNTRGRSGGRAIGGGMLSGGQVQPHLSIRSSVVRKARHYGDIDIPLIIAVNSLELYANEEASIESVFGTEAVVVSEGQPDKWVRNPDGAWRGQSGPINRRASGLLSTERLTPWSLAQRSARLIINPWALNPAGDLSLGVDGITVVDDSLQKEVGSTWREIFTLDDGWPE